MSSRARRQRLALVRLEPRDVPSMTPSAVEQVFLERLNDARENPAAYGTTVGVDLGYIAASAPLAFDTRIIEAARLHSQDMNANRFFSHTGTGGTSPWQRMANAGYPWTSAAESIAAGYGSPEAALRALVIDAGVPSLGHRHHLLAHGGGYQHREVGIGLVLDGTGPYSHYHTIDSGNTSDARPYITGVVFRDADGDRKYDAGEGLSGVTLTVTGGPSVTTWDTGGYALRVNAGTYTVTASGGGLSAPVTRTVTVGSANVRNTIDAGGQPPPPPNAPPSISDVGNVSVAAGSSTPPLAFTVSDAETPAGALAVTAASSNPALTPTVTLAGTGTNRTVTVTAAAGQSGTATVTLTVTDAAGATDTDTFDVTVTLSPPPPPPFSPPPFTPPPPPPPPPFSPPGNTAPTISGVAGVTVPRGRSTAAIGFTVSDAETPAAALAVSVSTSDPDLVPLSGVALGGAGGSRTVTVTPAYRTGTAVVTLTVTDGAGGRATTAFAVTVRRGGGTLTRTIGVGAGGGSSARVTTDTGGLGDAFDALPGADGVRTAAADFTGDGVADLAVGSGPGGPATVRVLDGVTGAEFFAALPFDGFTGGVFVAAGDLTGDGRPELVITPDEGGGPRCRVFAYTADGFAQVADFFGIEDPNFRGGARAAVGDITGDGVGDLIVAAGYGGGPRVAVWDGASLDAGAYTRKPFGDQLVFDPSLRNGVYVAAADLNGDGCAELVAGAGPGGGPHVRALDGLALCERAEVVERASFFAGDLDNRGGVRVAVKDLDGDGLDDLVTGSGAGGGSRVTGFLGTGSGFGAAPVLAVDAYPGDARGVYVG